MIGSFILLRVSKDSYLQNLFTLNERGDSAVFDALLAGLVATALVFLSGMVENFSRGASVLYVATTVIFLALSRWPFHRMLDRMARRGVIGQRIAFYGADPGSIERDPARCWRRATSATSTSSALPTTGPSCPKSPACASSAAATSSPTWPAAARSTRC